MKVKVAREYRLGDEVAINRGFNRVFHVERELNEWEWKYPASGEGRAITLIEREGEIVAHFAGLPLRYQIDGQVCDIFTAVDAFSSDSARFEPARGGDMRATAEAFFEIYAAEGRRPFVFRFAGPQPQQHGGLDFGFETLSPTSFVILRRRTLIPRNRFRRLYYRAELAPDWEPRLDTLWRQVSQDYPVAMVRDADSALRRFAGHPHITYNRFLIFPRFKAHPVGWVVFRIDKGCCWWVDLLWDHQYPGVLDLAAALSRRLCAQAGIKEEGLWLGGDHDGLKALLGLGFEVRSEPIGLSLSVRRLDPDFDLGLLKGRTYITMADADLI